MSRLLVAGIAASLLVVAGYSARSVSGPRLQLGVAQAAAARPARADTSDSDPPAPADVVVELAEDGRGRRLTLRRPGRLVALQGPGGRAAAMDWVTVRIDGDLDATARVVWEATDPHTLATTQGRLRIDPVGHAVRASVTDPPTPLSELRGPLHRCLPHAHLAGGFVVICRLQAAASDVHAVNVTGARPLEDVWVVRPESARLDAAPWAAKPHGSALVRLDLPALPGEANARMVTYKDGALGVALRAEASWVAGEATPTLVLARADSRQPVGGF